LLLEGSGFPNAFSYGIHHLRQVFVIVAQKL